MADGKIRLLWYGGDTARGMDVLILLRIPDKVYAFSLAKRHDPERSTWTTGFFAIIEKIKMKVVGHVLKSAAPLM